MMKGSFWIIALLMSLIMLGPAAYAEEAKPAGNKPDLVLVPLTPENIKRMKDEKQKAQEAKKAKEDEAAHEKEKKAKIKKIEHRTGRACKSWQVKNR